MTPKETLVQRATIYTKKRNTLLNSLTKFNVWRHLQYRIYISKCFRQDSASKVIRYFKYLNLPDYALKRIVDDLFVIKHDEEGILTWCWVGGSVEELNESKVIFPREFIDPLIDAYIKVLGEYDSFSWRIDQYPPLLTQPNISGDSLVRQVTWIKSNTRRDDQSKRLGLIDFSLKENYPDFDPIDTLFKHPNMKGNALTILAGSGNSEIRDKVRQHPLCPREALITLSLMNSNTGIPTEMIM